MNVCICDVQYFIGIVYIKVKYYFLYYIFFLCNFHMSKDCLGYGVGGGCNCLYVCIKKKIQ